MIFLRQAQDRGYASHGWLESWHSFSFADYYDANFMGFSALRVINEDVISGGKGFGMHPHKDMEIVTYVLAGVVEHQDSMGNKAQIPAGEFQMMSAGSGVRHSEFNGSLHKPLHLYQIWIIPDRQGIEPRYQQRRFNDRPGRQMILSPDEREGSLKVHQDMTLSRWQLTQEQQVTAEIGFTRKTWIQVVKGTIQVDGQRAGSSDALAIENEAHVHIHAESDSEILLFDLPS